MSNVTGCMVRGPIMSNVTGCDSGVCYKGRNMCCHLCPEYNQCDYEVKCADTQLFISGCRLMIPVELGQREEN